MKKKASSKRKASLVHFTEEKDSVFQALVQDYGVIIPQQKARKLLHYLKKRNHSLKAQQILASILLESCFNCYQSGEDPLLLSIDEKRVILPYLSFFPHNMSRRLLLALYLEFLGSSRNYPSIPIQKGLSLELDTS